MSTRYRSIELFNKFGVLLILFGMGLSFVLTATIVWLFAWATGWFVFTWKIAAVVWLVVVLIKL